MEEKHSERYRLISGLPPERFDRASFLGCANPREIHDKKRRSCSFDRGAFVVSNTRTLDSTFGGGTKFHGLTRIASCISEVRFAQARER